MDTTFQKAHCYACKWAILAGEDAQGGYRVRRCTYRFAHATKDRRSLKGGDDLRKLDACPKAPPEVVA